MQATHSPSGGTQSGIGGFLGWIEKSGNKLPDPVFLFLWLILALVVISVIASLAGLSAAHPTLIEPATGTNALIVASSLLSPDNIARLWMDMPTTFTHFHPLGYVLVVMLGAGVAERAGLFSTGMRAAARNKPKTVLTPIVVLAGMMGNLAADAATLYSFRWLVLFFMRLAAIQLRASPLPSPVFPGVSRDSVFDFDAQMYQRSNGHV